MKFFATACVMALAAGSAVAHAVPRSTAIPEIKALSGVGLPTDFSGYTKAPVEIPEVEKPEIEIPEVEIPEVARRDDDVEVEVGDVEVEVSGLPLAEVSEVVKVTQNVTVIVNQVKALVAEDLAQIRTCLRPTPLSEPPPLTTAAVEAVGMPEVDVDTLLSLIKLLKSHIEILLKEVVSKLVALVFKAASLEEVDLEIVSDLLVEIKSIVTEVESTLQTLVESDLKLGRFRPVCSVILVADSPQTSSLSSLPRSRPRSACSPSSSPRSCSSPSPSFPAWTSTRPCRSSRRRLATSTRSCRWSAPSLRSCSRLSEGLMEK